MTADRTAGRRTLGRGVRRAGPDVADALVVGTPSERWGEEAVALIALHDADELADDLLYKHCTAHLANVRAPKVFIVVEHIRRLGNGRAD